MNLEKYILTPSALLEMESRRMFAKAKKSWGLGLRMLEGELARMHAVFC